MRSRSEDKDRNNETTTRRREENTYIKFALVCCWGWGDGGRGWQTICRTKERPATAKAMSEKTSTTTTSSVFKKWKKKVNRSEAGEPSHVHVSLGRVI